MTKDMKFELGMIAFILVLCVVLPAAIGFVVGRPGVMAAAGWFGLPFSVLLYLGRWLVQATRKRQMAKGDSGRFFDFSDYRRPSMPLTRETAGWND